MRLRYKIPNAAMPETSSRTVEGSGFAKSPTKPNGVLKLKLVVIVGIFVVTVLTLGCMTEFGTITIDPIESTVCVG